MSWKTLCLKYLVVILNYLLSTACFFITIFLGRDVKENFPGEFKTIGLLIASFGLVIPMLGNYAVRKRKLCILWTYAFALLLLQCMTIIVLSLAYNVTSLSLRTLDAAWEKEKIGYDGMSDYQEKLSCCGIYGPQNYNDTGMPYPVSCFSQNHTVFSQGCLDRLKDSYDIGLEMYMKAAWILLAVQFVLYVCSSIWSGILTTRSFKYTVNKVY